MKTPADAPERNQWREYVLKELLRLENEAHGYSPRREADWWVLAVEAGIPHDDQFDYLMELINEGTVKNIHGGVRLTIGGLEEAEKLMPPVIITREKILDERDYQAALNKAARNVVVEPSPANLQALAEALRKFDSSGERCPNRESNGVRCEKSLNHLDDCACPEALSGWLKARNEGKAPMEYGDFVQVPIFHEEIPF